MQVLEHLTSATDDMRILVRDIRDEVRAQNQRDLEVTGPLLDKIKTRLEADDA